VKKREHGESEGWGIKRSLRKRVEKRIKEINYRILDLIE
jgi:hypothetical protein